LEAGAFKLEFDSASGAYAVSYFQHLFPIDPKTYPLVLEQNPAQLEAGLGAEHARYLEFQSLVAALRRLPARTEVTAEKLNERHRDKEVYKKRLARLSEAVPEIRQHIEQTISLYNGSELPTARVDLMHALLEAQAYRLANWRVAADEINYRRFFDINELAGLRMENPQAFLATHRLISELVAQGKIDGLRIDHPDGLYDPVEYFQRLQGFVTAANGAAPVTESADGTAAGELPLYVISEKILASYEHLPQDWPIHGTTGYDFANQVNAVLIDPSAERELDRCYARFIGRSIDFDELLYERKKLIMRVALSSELTVLANQINRISESSWQARDFTLTALRAALTEVVAYFPVYRTYVTGRHITAEDRRYIDWAVALAKKRNPAADVSIYDFIRSVLLLDGLEQRPEEYRRACADFTMRFQQYTAPVMAKGFEDTSFYIYNRLVSLNEVGGDPRRFGTSIGAFHHANSERARHWPHTMLCTSTHDSKRSEDVRARINVLSELAAEWRARSARWRRLNRAKKRKINGDLIPDRNDEYLLYQTLVGAWPLGEMDDSKLTPFRDRIDSYMLKAVREAKVHTSWIQPNTEYEEAMTHFVRSLLAPGRNVFLEDFLPFQKRVLRFGLLNSLSQVLLKLTSPGVPDLYQGSELWDFSLVDPDNRRPVDYERRASLLNELEQLDNAPPPGKRRLVRALLDNLDDGRAKLYLTWKTLGLRAAYVDVFQHGDYTPLAIEGPRAEHLCAYARTYRKRVVVAVAPRWYARLADEGQLSPPPDCWHECRIQAPDANAQQYQNLFTGTPEIPQVDGDKSWFAASGLLADFPLALLSNQS
jgi:(1->4)-alpha-D-glucan 1-alpha-D-glucosylmutase